MFNKTLLKELRPQRKIIALILLFSSIVTILEILAIFPFKFLIDNVLENQPFSQYSFTEMLVSFFSTKISLGFFLIFVFFFSKLFASIVDFGRSLMVKKVTKNILSNVSKTVFSNLEMLSIGFYNKQQIGDYIYRLSYDVSAFGELIEQGIIPLLSSAISILITALILFLIDPLFGVLSIISLPILWMALYIINKKIVLASRKSEYWNSSIFSFLQQTLTHLKVIQAYTQEKRELQQFHKKMNVSLESEIHIQKIGFVFSLLIGVFIALMYALVVGLGLISVFEGELSAGLLIIAIFYLYTLTPQMLNFVYAFLLIRQSRIKISRIEDFFNQTYKVKDSGTIDQIKDTTIEFKHIDLVGDANEKILKDVSFSVPQGKITAIIGTSGSGKTSIVSLIPRFLSEPNAGRIYLGEHPIDHYLLKTLRENISYVPQEILLFDRSIKDVIGFGKDHASLEEIKKAAKLAVADEFIEKLPQGYNFLVGEGGVHLSVGQRQRLMLARAYIKDAPIVILDEVFASEDAKTKLEMLGKFRGWVKGKTALIVSNDLEIIAEADEVVIIHNGTAVKVLTHQQLIEKKLLKESTFEKLLLGET